MKKLFTVLVFVAFVVSYDLQAQSTLSLMPKAGITISNVNTPQREFDNVSKLGITGGVALNVGVSEIFSVQPELNFVQKGAASKSFRVEDDFSNTLTLNYLELPILARISFGGEVVKGYVIGGPSFGLGFGGKIKIEADGGSAETNVKFGDAPVEADELYFDNSIDFGIQIGAGIQYQLGAGSLVLDGRMGLGISNLYKEDSSQLNVGADNTSKNRVFSITLGYMIPLGK